MESGQVHQQKAHEFIFRSKLPDIEIPDHLPLHTYCFQNISRFKDRPCLINSSTGESHTYADVELATRRFAAALHNLGIGHGDVVMLLLHNCPEFAFAFLGASRLGAITTAANPLYTPAELARQARASGAKLVITQSAYAEKVREFVQENTYVKVACVDAPPEGWCNMQSLSELLHADEAETPRVDIRPNDVVALPYSSGTTGLPKGVMLSHKQLVTSVGQLVDGENPNLYFHSEDVILCVLPLFHIYALNTIFLSGIRAGAAILIMQRFEIGKLLEIVEKYKVTVTPFVPPILLSIVKCPDLRRHDLSSIRMIITGGAPMGKELEEAVKDKLPRPKLGQGYGMTEGGSVSMCLAFAKESFPAKSGACGTVVRNAEVKIIDPNTGVSLPRNQAGEICIRGNQIMKGFLNDPKATKETIDEGGWLHTGDIGYIDDDDEVFIVDRLKEIIKYKGFQVAPAELEALLISHPCISDAAVVPMKDEVAGEVPVAFVVRSSGSYVTEEDIKQYISKQVVFYKRIRQVFFIEKITKSPSGKILRKDLRNGLTTGLA